jgi:hypothetical protein
MANSSRPWFSPVALAAGLASAGFAISTAGFAQSAPTPPTGAPPPDATALVAAPKDPLTVPDVKKPLDGTSLSLSAGGQYATGNTRLLAATVNGQYESRWGNNGIGASLLGNYGQGAPPGANIVETAENVQGRFRYDRYVLDQASVFLINTVRHDRLQGLEVRYNLDPGFKYLFLTASTNTLWVEAGYDFQYDVREDAARVQFDANGAPLPGLLPKTQVDHAKRSRSRPASSTSRASPTVRTTGSTTTRSSPRRSEAASRWASGSARGTTAIRCPRRRTSIRRRP